MDPRYSRRVGLPTQLAEGDALPSIRVLARDLQISVITTTRAYADLVRYLRDDKALRENFFSRLQMMYYSGASLPAV